MIDKDPSNFNREREGKEDDAKYSKLIKSLIDVGDDVVGVLPTHA